MVVNNTKETVVAINSCGQESAPDTIRSNDPHNTENPDTPLLKGRSDKVIATISTLENTDVVPILWYRQPLFGYLAATFNGLYGGSIVAPLSFAKKYDDHLSGIDYVFSFAVGSTIVNLALLLIYTIILSLQKRTIITLKDLRIVTIPAICAGLLWSIGNICSIFAVLHLGQAIGYSACQANVLVCGLWGIFYFREINGFPIFLWFMSALIAIGSLFGLSLLHG